MADNQSQVAEAMRAVVQAHEVLRSFHEQVAALFELADDDLAKEVGGFSLVPLKSASVVSNSSSSIKNATGGLERSPMVGVGGTG